MSFIIKKYTELYFNKWNNFVLNYSLNGTIYHTKSFLNYHKNKYNDASILIYDKTNIIAVFPCCKFNNKYYSHLGSTCGGLVILKKYYELNKLFDIMDLIYEYYDEDLNIKLSETIYFKNNIKNDLLSFVLSQKCKQYQDICLYFDIKKNPNILDSFPNNDNKRLLKKYINNTNKDTIIEISNNLEDYEKYYYILEKNLKDKNNIKPIHTLNEFISLKELLGCNQFLFLSKNFQGEILSGAFVFLINDNTYYTVYLMTNYEKKQSQIFNLLYELFIHAKKNNIDIVNIGACSKNNGKEILFSKYKFKHSCGCDPVLKYYFSYTKKKKIETDRLFLKKMCINEQYLISYFWQNNNYSKNMFFFKENTFDYNKQIKWYNNIEQDSSSIYFSIFEKENKNFIGYCGIKNITIDNCEVFIVLLDENYYHKKLGEESFKELIKYTQNKLPGKNICLNVKDDNTNAIEMYKKLGFIIENINNNILKMIYIK